MISQEICLAILDTISHPIVFVDNAHVIRYMNSLAEKRYYEERGYKDLIGKSLMYCHNQESCEKIEKLYRQLQDGEDEIFNWINEQGEKITVVAVRDARRNLMGYYERFEKMPHP